MADEKKPIRIVVFEVEEGNDGETLKSVKDIVEIDLTDDPKKDWRSFSKQMKIIFEDEAGLGSELVIDMGKN